MTLVVTINGPESNWLLADRRLSYGGGRPPKDDGCKVMVLETPDGVAFLGYAGLGATALGIQPSDWMSAVLRGRSLLLEQSLGVLAEAMKKQFPTHMLQMPGHGGQTHDVVIPAFLGTQPALYSIGLAFAADRKSYTFRATRYFAPKPPGTTKPPRVTVAGTGGLFLAMQQKKQTWLRDLLRVVRANDCNQVPPLVVADHLAKLNNEVHRNIRDESVGPRCIVIWRYRKGRVQNAGPGVQCYTNTTRDSDVAPIPTIAGGMDVGAICDVIAPHMFKQLTKMMQAKRAGQPAAPKLNEDEIKAELARLPDKPDENLR